MTVPADAAASTGSAAGTAAAVADPEGCELCIEGERFFDYLLLPYRPAAPAAGKLRSVNLLRASFALMDVAAAGDRLIAALRRRMGPAATVWGIRSAGGATPLSWELYFYRRDTGRGEPEIGDVLAALAPCVRVASHPPLPHRWELWSCELDAAALAAGTGGAIDVYTGMRAYRAAGAALELKNLYTFEDPGLRLDRVLERLLTAVHPPRDGDQIARLLPAGLLDGCPRVCVANKRHADGLYFSGVAHAQLRTFAATHDWPPAILAWLDRHAGRLDHLLWDVGFDFHRAGADLQVPRSSIFGFL